MSNHTATVTWTRETESFADGKYSRAHIWEFDGGLSVEASASPDVIPIPYSDTAAVDPEEAFVASLSSCHMLWFLDLARRKGFVVDAYTDKAVGHMTANSGGKRWISKVELNPDIQWADPAPTKQVVIELHEQAHENCFIANSVRTDVVTNIL